MAQIAHAFKGAFGLGVHATSLTDLRQSLVARSAWTRFHDLKIDHDDGSEFDPTSGKAVAEDASLGDYDVRIRATLEGTTEGAIPYLIRSLLGGQPATTTVGTTGKQHVFDLADTIPLNGGRFSYESVWGTSGNGEAGNAVCQELTYSLDQEGYARWMASMLGSSPAFLSSPTTPSLPSKGTWLSFRKTTFTLDAETTHVVRNCRWTLKRNLVEDDYDGTSHQRRDTGYGELVPSFDAELSFVNSDNFRRYWGSKTANGPATTPTYYAVNIKSERYDVIPGGTAVHTVMLDLPAVKLMPMGLDMKGRSPIRLRMTGQGTDNGTYPAKVTLINSVASYA